MVSVIEGFHCTYSAPSSLLPPFPPFLSASSLFSLKHIYALWQLSCIMASYSMYSCPIKQKFVRLPRDSTGTELLFQTFLLFLLILALSSIILYPPPPNPWKFFKLDVLYEVPGGCLAAAPGSHIVEELHHILRVAPTPSEHPVGILTTEQRDTWYQARQRLSEGTYVGNSFSTCVLCMVIRTPLSIEYTHQGHKHKVI